MEHGWGEGVRDGHETHARRTEAQALRSLLERLPGHLGAVVWSQQMRPLPLSGVRRWRLVPCRPDPLAPRLGYPSAVFDAVLLLHPWSRDSNVSALVGEALRVLTDSGRLVILTRHPLAAGGRYAHDWHLGRLLRDQGLRVDLELVLYVAPLPSFPRLRLLPLDRLRVARRSWSAVGPVPRRSLLVSFGGSTPQRSHSRP